MARDPKRLHVMQVTHDLGIGGLPRVVVTLAHAIDRSRFDVSVLCMNAKGALADELESAGVPVLQVPSPRQPDRLAALRVLRILREQKVDILHTHNTQPFLEAGLAGVLAGVETLVHTDHGREWPDRRRYMWAERVMSRFAYRVVGVSEDTSAQLVRFEKLDARKVVTIPNGIDPTPFDRAVNPAETRRSLGLPDDARVICTVARFTREKGVDILIEALPEIFAAVPACVCLVVGYGDAEDNLKRRARALAVQDRTLFLGPRSDVPDLLTAADCYVLPSRREGLPMVILEAMAAGLPIVATRVGGVPGAVSEGESGSIVDVESPAALAGAVADLLRDPQRRERYGAEGRRRFERLFSADAMTRRYEGLYLRRPLPLDIQVPGVEQALASQEVACE